MCWFFLIRGHHVLCRLHKGYIHNYVGDKSSVGESVTTKLAITVGVGKYNGEKKDGIRV